MKHYLHLCFLAATLCGAVSCQQATEELTSTLSKSTTYDSYTTEDGLYDVTVDTEKKTATINYFTDKNEDKTNVTVPSTVTYQGVVYNVTGLDGVYLSSNKQVTSITLPDGLETIGAECFAGMAIEDINMPESVTSIGKSAFKSCTKLKHIKIPSKITIIPEEAFFGCESLQSVELPEGLEEIGVWAFGYSMFESIALPESLTKIDSYAFARCFLTSLTIPSKVSKIGEKAFYECDKLSQVTLGAGITSIADCPFKGCKNLNALYSYATTPPTVKFSNLADASIYNSCYVFVPKESVDAYKAADGWTKFKHIDSYEPDELPDAEKQIAAITDASTTIPEGTYKAGNLTYSRTNTKFATGVYVTICLPFSINLAETDCFSDVLMPEDIALYNTNSKMLTILMKKASSTAFIPAGTPFLAKLSGDKVELKNSTRTYIRSTYAEDLASNMTTKFRVYNYNGDSGVLESNEDLDVRFCGSFEKKTGLDNTKYKTFMADGRFGNADNIGIYRAYIYKANVESQNNVQALSISTDGVADDIIKGNYTIKGNKLIINK